MVRIVLDNLRRIAAALLLLIAVPCVVEVALRVQRCRGRVVDPQAVSQQLTQPHQQTLWQLSPHFKQSLVDPTTGVEFELRLNAYGLRGRTEVVVPRGDQTTRVLVLGDEAIFGGELADESTVTAMLQHSLQERSSTSIEVLNAGQPRGCPTLSLLQLQHRFAALQPQIILLHVDFSDLADEEAILRYVRRDDDGHPIAAAHPSLGLKTNAGRELDAEFLTIQWAREGLCREWLKTVPHDRTELGRRTDFEAWNDVDTPDGAAALAQMLASIVDLDRLSRRLDAELIVTTAPAAWQLAALLGKTDRPGDTGRSLSPTLAQRLPRSLRETCDAHGIRFIDATSAYQSISNPAPLFLQSSGMSSAVGNRLYADVLFAALTGRPSSHHASDDPRAESRDRR